MISSNKNISIIIPAYNEEDSLKELHTQILESVNQLKRQEIVNDYEIWFVNDGSSDETEKVIEEIHE